MSLWWYDGLGVWQYGGMGICQYDGSVCADLGWGQWFVEHLSACADPAVTQPVSQVGGANTK